MSVAEQKQEAEQNPLVESSSSVNVKTPLVDALRSYFWNISEAIEGQPATHR